MKKSREWYSSYARLRDARAKAALIRSRVELGRDIHTGMRYGEVAKLADLKLLLQEARFEQAARPEQTELVTDSYESAINAIVAASNTENTVEFASEIDDLLREAQKHRDTWVASLEREPETISE